MSADDALRAVAELAASQHGVFTRRQAAAHSFDRRRVATALRAGWIGEPVAGVLVIAGSRGSWPQRLMIASRAGQGAIVSHRSAARLHRLDGFRDDVIELTVRRGRSLRSPGAIVHRSGHLDDDAFVEVAGIPTTSLVRTLADLGAVVCDDQVEQAVDDALRRGLGLAALREALEYLDRPGPSGTASLRRVLDRPDRVGRLPDSWFERLVARVAAAGTLPRPELQHIIRDRSGQLLARLDLAWPEARLGLEAHSDRWHFGPRRGRRDLARDNALAATGWELVYATWSDLDQPDQLVDQLARIYRRRVVESRRLG